MEIIAQKELRSQEQKLKKVSSLLNEKIREDLPVFTDGGEFKRGKI